MKNVYCAVGLTTYKNYCTLTSKEVLPWLKRVVANFCPRGPGFVSKTFHPGFVVEKM